LIKSRPSVTSEAARACQGEVESGVVMAIPTL